MKPSLAITLLSLNPPVLSKSDLSALNSLQREWETHSECINRLEPDRIIDDQKAAYDRFLSNPSQENEQRLTVLADERLTAKRHAVLREARAEIRRRTNEKAAAILQPALEHARQRLDHELDAQQGALKAAGLNPWQDERCLELRRVMDQVALALNTVIEAAATPQGAELPPRDMVAGLLDLDFEALPESPESPA